MRTTGRRETGASVATRGEGVDEDGKGRGWKTAKICITIADRNNYARNARERGGGIRTRMQMRTVESDAGGDGGVEGVGTITEGRREKDRGGFEAAETRARNADTGIL